MKLSFVPALICAAASSLFAQTGELHLLQRPAMNKDLIVFSYGGDLWSGRTLARFDMKTRKPETLASGIASFDLSANGDKIGFTGATLQSPAPIRRVDLDGAGESHPLARDELPAPGHWEISVPRGDYYVASVRNSCTAATHSGAWWGFDSGTYTRLSVALSSTPCGISGVVFTNGNPVAGAPVFVGNAGGSQTWTVRSNPQGNYYLGGLAPGTYTIMSGFDVDLNDPATALKVDTVSASEGNTTAHALEMILP
jgi:hypothetical protein